MEKYGFIYLWYDRKHKRFYIGCHWGHEKDGYTCSSDWMRKSIKRRPQDFKRKILKTGIMDRKLLLEEEFKFLSKIKDEELGKRYYNLTKQHFGHWSALNNNQMVKEKISAAKIGKCMGEENPFFGKRHSEETRIKIKEARAKQVLTEEHKQNIRKSHIGEKNHFYGKTHDEDTRLNIANKIKTLWQDPEYRKMQLEKRKKI